VGADAGVIMVTSKISLTFKRVSNVLLVAIPVLSVVYFLWTSFSIPLVFYINNYHTLSYIGAFILSGGYIFTTCLLIFAKDIHKSRNKLLGISVFVITIPICCLSNAIAISLPTVMDKTKISNTTYYLTGELETFDIHAFHRLYKCNNSSFLCEQTPFQAGGGASFQPLHLMIDKTTNPNEINVTWTSYDGKATVLEYTYGTQPRYYDYPAQLNNHLYYLAYNDKPNSTSTAYLLYECELDNTSCKQLPIKYDGFGYLRDTVADEKTGEVNVFIDNQINQDTLIFTWGEHPRCYVEACEILENLK
jgi:hypothetical protein